MTNLQSSYQCLTFSIVFRFRCNFGPEDKTGIVPQDMQALLKSTQKKSKKKSSEIKAKRGRKTIPDYDAFPVTCKTGQKI